MYLFCHSERSEESRSQRLPFRFQTLLPLSEIRIAEEQVKRIIAALQCWILQSLTLLQNDILDFINSLLGIGKRNLK